MKMACRDHGCLFFNKDTLKVIYQQSYFIGDFKIILQPRSTGYISPIPW
jgi:hypothetical protein